MHLRVWGRRREKRLTPTVGKSVGKYFKTAASVIVEVDVGIYLLSPTVEKRRERRQDRSICNYATTCEDLASRNAVGFCCT